jgi:fatty acid desaturase
MYPGSQTSNEKVAVTDFIKNAKPKTGKALVNLLFWSWGLLILGVLPYCLYHSIWTFALAFLVVTSRMGALLALAHDAQHLSFLPDKKWNDLIGAWACAYPMGSIFGSSKAVHMAHHKLLNKPEDPDRNFHIENNKDTPRQFVTHFARLVCGGQLWTSIVVNGVLRPIAKNKPCEKPPVVVLGRAGHPEILNLIPVQLVIWGCLWLASGQWWLYIVLWLGPIFTLGTFLGFLRGFVDHARLRSEAENPEDPARDRLITVLEVNWLERAYLAPFSFNYHAEHHIFPSVPPYYLPELHKLMQKSEYYRNTYAVRKSYSRFIADYWRQISDNTKPRLQTVPNYSLPPKPQKSHTKTSSPLARQVCMGTCRLICWL